MLEARQSLVEELYDVEERNLPLYKNIQYGIISYTIYIQMLIMI